MLTRKPVASNAEFGSTMPKIWRRDTEPDTKSVAQMPRALAM
jgi:hypothetical protein